MNRWQSGTEILQRKEKKADRKFFPRNFFAYSSKLFFCSDDDSGNDLHLNLKIRKDYGEQTFTNLKSYRREYQLPTALKGRDGLCVSHRRKENMERMNEQEPPRERFVRGCKKLFGTATSETVVIILLRTNFCKNISVGRCEPAIDAYIYHETAKS